MNRTCNNIKQNFLFDQPIHCNIENKRTKERTCYKKKRKKRENLQVTNIVCDEKFVDPIFNGL